MGTPKALRQPPTNLVENYTLTREFTTKSGLTSISSDLFSLVPGSPGTPFAAGGYNDPPIPIGFNFSFDNRTYTRMIIGVNGFIVLVEPIPLDQTSATTLAFVYSADDNESLRTENIPTSVVLCPWNDSLINTTNKLSDVVSSADRMSRMLDGLEATPVAYRPSDYGVRYYVDPRSKKGRRLIVRWNSMSGDPNNLTVALTRIVFEAVLYENGTIEYRYAPRNTLSIVRQVDEFNRRFETATCGVFASLRGVQGNRGWRDFALPLTPGQDDYSMIRREYEFGGYIYDSQFLEAGYSHLYLTTLFKEYSWRLNPYDNWPGQEAHGTTFVFTPPKNLRKVLPRLLSRELSSVITLPTVARTGDMSRLGNDTSLFDDRRTPTYTNIQVTGSTEGVVVNYPTTLQRLYGNGAQGITERQDLFSTVGLQATGSIVKSAVDPFVGITVQGDSTPYSEVNQYGITSSTNSFFVSGTSVDLVGEGLSQPLKSKTQVKISFPVKITTRMFGVSASIYYYNKRQQSWRIPVNSVSASNQSNQGSQSDIANFPFGASFGSKIFEEARGFGPTGDFNSSGSKAYSASGQSHDSIGRELTLSPTASSTNPYALNVSENITEALEGQYEKSIQLNQEYAASTDESFVLPITQPFLIEKAVIEFPLAAGAGWFSDKTSCFITDLNVKDPFDFGGPGLTVSLFNQIKTGETSIRDLILSGTVTHSVDNVSELIFDVPTFATTSVLRPQGFLAFSSPSAVVTPTLTAVGNSFTGSVVVPTSAMTSNGVTIRTVRRMYSGLSGTNGGNEARQLVLDLFNTREQLIDTSTFSGSSYLSTRIAYVKPYGRNGKGFNQSGRSVFGKEFNTKQLTNGRYPNPFYIDGAPKTVATITTGALGQQFVTTLLSGSPFVAIAAVSLKSYEPSPYLVRPGDKLVLAISKTRPFIFRSTLGAPGTSGSISHDVQLITGSVNITLYGSLLKEGKEYHDTLNQTLSSDAIHEIVIGNEPVLDQFEIGYKEEFSGSYNDAYITGSLVSVQNINNKLTFITGSRGRVFSKIGATNFGFPRTDSHSFNLQPWFERVGTQYVVSHDDSTERYWDSLMPSISEALSIDGNNIFIPENDAATRELLFVRGNFDQSGTLGWIIFNYSYAFSNAEKITNKSWQMGYPFEPRYLSLARQKQATDSYTATKVLTFTGGGSITDIVPTRVKNLMIWTKAWAEPSRFSDRVNTANTQNYSFVDYITSDFKLNSNLTSSMSQVDTTKFLYGFGDKNTMSLFGYAGGLGGTGANNLPTMLTSGALATGPGFSGAAYYHVGPVIRGWKYGVYNGLPSFSKAYYRKGRYGQFRDMLEQRQFTKFYLSFEKGRQEEIHGTVGPGTAAVTVKFIDSDGKLTNPENTWSQNLSLEATSSLPYFDGLTRNRTNVNVATLNSNVVTISSDQFGSTTI